MGLYTVSDLEVMMKQQQQQQGQSKDVKTDDKRDAGAGTGNGNGSTPRPRWCPTAEQIQVLEALFNSGTTTPSRDMIVDIANCLKQYGSIVEANVFYWFQNRKARAKRKLAQQKEQQQRRRGSVGVGGGYGADDAVSGGRAAKRACYSNILAAATSMLPPPAAAPAYAPHLPALSTASQPALTGQLGSYAGLVCPPSAAGLLSSAPDAAQLASLAPTAPANTNTSATNNNVLLLPSDHHSRDWIDSLLLQYFFSRYGSRTLLQDFHPPATTAAPTAVPPAMSDLLSTDLPPLIFSSSIGTIPTNTNTNTNTIPSTTISTNNNNNNYNNSNNYLYHENLPLPHLLPPPPTTRTKSPNAKEEVSLYNPNSILDDLFSSTSSCPIPTITPPLTHYTFSNSCNIPITTPPITNTFPSPCKIPPTTSPSANLAPSALDNTYSQAPSSPFPSLVSTTPESVVSHLSSSPTSHSCNDLTLWEALAPYTIGNSNNFL